VVLCGCEIWSLILREEERLKVFENSVLRRIFGPKRDKVTGGWRELHNEELRMLYSWPSKIRTMKASRMRGAVQLASIGEKKNAYRIFVAKPERRRPLGRPRHRFENNIKMDLR
jgi:hypothetical protein